MYHAVSHISKSITISESQSYEYSITKNTLHQLNLEGRHNAFSELSVFSGGGWSVQGAQGSATALGPSRDLTSVFFRTCTDSNS